MVLCGSVWPTPARYRFIASNLEIKLKGFCLDLQHTYRTKYLHIGANMSETGQEPKRRSEHPTQSVQRLSQHASSDVKQVATSAQHAHGTPRGTRHSAMLVWIPQPEATSSVESAQTLPSTETSGGPICCFKIAPRRCAGPLSSVPHKAQACWCAASSMLARMKCALSLHLPKKWRTCMHMGYLNHTSRWTCQKPVAYSRN